MKTKAINFMMALVLSTAGALAQTPANPPEQPPPPEQPAPTQPAPTQPAPTQPAPTQPAPTQPAPDQPAPDQPAQSAPEQPAPTQSAPEGQPAQPDEVAPPAVPQALDPELEGAKDAFRKGEYSSSLDLSKKVLARRPEDIEGLYVAGVSSLRLGQLDGADTFLNKLLEVEPRMPNIFFHLGHLAFAKAEELSKEGHGDEAKGMYAEAAKKFEAEIARDPTQIQPIQSLALALARAGQYDEAVKAYEAWIAVAPKSIRPYLALGSLNAELGRADDALAILDRMPKDNAKAATEGAFAIARTLFSKEKYAETRTFIVKMRELSLESRPADGLLSATYARLGRLQESAQALCKFMSQNPPQEESSSLGEVLKMSFGGTWAEEKAPKLMPKGSMPELDRPYSPRYPPEARKDRIETQVMLMVVVKADGTPGDTCTVPSGVLEQLRQYGIEQAAVDCVRRWKFTPARKEGAPVDAYYPAVVTFSLH